MSNWFHRFLNPHCPHCVEEKHEEKVCPSCEILRTQVDRLLYENNRLLDRILEKPAPEPAREPVKITLPNKNIPWSVRRQMLEAEDREKARLIKDAPQPVPVADLEKEMDIVSATRERESVSQEA
jgi:hypothetical protein